jgi:hypothetical protein
MMVTIMVAVMGIIKSKAIMATQATVLMVTAKAMAKGPTVKACNTANPSSRTQCSAFCMLGISNNRGLCYNGRFISHQIFQDAL